MFKEWKKIVCRPLRIMDMLIGLAVIGMTVFLLLYWKYIPEEVPLHWNAAGEIDDYADAGGYLVILILMYFFYAWHSMTKLLPMFCCKENLFGKVLAEKVSQKDEYEAMNVLFALLWCCDLLCQIMCSYILLCGVFLRNLGIWFLPIVFGMFLVVFVWFFIRLNQVKRNAAKGALG